MAARPMRMCAGWKARLGKLGFVGCLERLLGGGACWASQQVEESELVVQLNVPVAIPAGLRFLDPNRLNRPSCLLYALSGKQETPSAMR